ncbi:MAG: hypothetical protein NDJ94_15490 [Vicinamibacteria bacterium]|jgi:hypothetical protein|nr:hypothetical protein [Vicinamibacteria bacterium]
MPGPLTIISLLLLGGVVSAAALFWLLTALDRNGDLTKAVQKLFRRGPKAPQAPGPDHYYTAFWAKRG